mgnify:CR=1 FL=1
MTINLSNLSKKFGESVVLDDVSLEVNPGDVIALIGASGAGKSTFLRSINYLEAPDSGRIQIEDLTVDYANISKKEILALRRKTAMVFQQFNLFERRTALENVMEGLIQVKKLDKVVAATQAAQELAKVGLSDRMDYYPKFLSGGQKQRVAIARALANDPDIIIADEPTGALDSQNTKDVLSILSDIAKSGKTVIVVTHSQEVADHGTRIVHLADGQVTSDERIKPAYPAVEKARD